MASLQGFPKREHLCLRRDIEALYERPDGTATAWPIRCIWRRLEEADAAASIAQITLPTAQVLISVSKRRLHHAVDRNRAKRQIREAYRLNKQLLTAPYADASTLSADASVQRLHIAFMWLADQPQNSDRVHHAIRRLLRKISQPSELSPTE
ncbi:MAG: ribonuclease P protein component [Bacteroidaceae bacterium]|nr:ribonuclease P protein component [Bacteroidaceae bacterium]